MDGLRGEETYSAIFPTRQHRQRHRLILLHEAREEIITNRQPMQSAMQGFGVDGRAGGGSAGYGCGHYARLTC